MDNLLDLLDLRGCACTVIVGAGGKTSALFRLAWSYDAPAWVSNTAHLAVEQGAYADRVFTVESRADVEAAIGSASAGVSLFTGPVDARGRTHGLEGETLDALYQAAVRRGIPLLIEADGSRGLPLKAPAAWEPPVPPCADAVIVAVGLSGLGKPLDAAWAYRPEDFSALSGLPLGQPVSAEALAQVLTHPQGGLKNIPPEARRAALLNQADRCDRPFEEVERLAVGLLDGFGRVLVASLHGAAAGNPPQHVRALYGRVAGIVLAAGAARRMGQPKQLLDWNGEPLARRAARTALQAGLSPVVVVTGAHQAAVQAAVEGLELRVVNNTRWEEGQSTSVAAGLAALEANCLGAVFLLADQPFVEADLVRTLRRQHALTRAPVVAPRVGERRSNPILFDRQVFADLARVQGDAGGRQVLARWPVTYLDWPDERILLDIDDEQDYRRAKMQDGG